uniref:Uncharacterized protein n=1 Tax=Rhizophagus irregularis (strain DAOM 181602 / DAOM 197198 / MUCL 43194) TaxID=747089 RepID=U9TGQ8_RHIID
MGERNSEDFFLVRAPSAELLNLRILRFPPFNNFELIHTLTGSSKASSYYISVTYSDANFRMHSL